MAEANEKQPWIALALATIIAAQLFVLIPFTIYLGNAEEFVTPVTAVLQWCMVLAVALLLALLIPGGLLRAQGHHRYIVTLAVLGLLIWVQSNLIAWDYGILDGRSIEWSIYPWRGWVDLGIWTAAVLMAITLHKRIGKVVIPLCIFIFVLQLVLTLQSGYSNRAELFKIAPTPTADTLQNIYSFSPDRNILHIVFDGFQSDIFEELVNYPELGEHYRAAFSGFVFYNESLGAFPYTRFAVPAFLSGKIYHNDIPKNDFIREVLAGKTILNEAHSSGFEVDLIGEKYFTALYTVGEHNNAFVLPPGGHAAQSILRSTTAPQS
jgi:hypothetical protein